jgi:PPOX class probable F420-dependent enzyme
LDEIPVSHFDLLEKPMIAALATLMPDGQPQVNNVWCRYSGGFLQLFTIQGSQKEKNLRVRKRATALFMDPTNPFRYLEVRSLVEDYTTQGAEALADSLTQKYLGQPAYFGAVMSLEQKNNLVLVAFNLRTTRVVAVG